MTKRKKHRRSTRRGLGCGNCGQVNGLGAFDMRPRPSLLKYAALAGLAYVVYTKVVKPSGGLGAIFLPDGVNANPSLNRPYPGVPFYPGR